MLRVATDEVLRSELTGRGAERSAELSWSSIARRHLTVWEGARDSSSGARRG
jgi:hypothetical protein